MKFCKYYRLNKLLAFSLFVLLGTPRTDARKIRVESNTKIIFEKYDTEYFRLKRYLQTVDNLTAMLLRSRRNVKLLPRIVVVDKKKMKQDINIVQAGRTVNIYVNGNLEQWRDNATVNKHIISTLLFAKCDIRPGKRSLPDWLLTGLYAELKYKTAKKLFSPATYLPGIIALVRAGKIPELSAITAHPIKEKDGEAYLLYEEFCRFLLSISEELCRDEEEAFAEIVVLSATGNYSQQEIFSSTLGRVAGKRYRSKKQLKGSDDEIVRQWFRRMLIGKAANYFFPLSAKAVDKKFKQLFPVECEVKIGNEKYKTVSLTLLQLPAYWEKIKQPFGVKSALTDQLGDIIAQSPIFISNPLHLLRQQIYSIGKNSSKAEQKALKAALSDYYKALAQQIAIENYLGDIEQRESWRSEYYYRQMEVIGRNKANPWQAMKQYLDNAEKKYLE